LSQGGTIDHNDIMLLGKRQQSKVAVVRLPHVAFGNVAQRSFWKKRHTSLDSYHTTQLMTRRVDEFTFLESWSIDRSKFEQSEDGMAFEIDLVFSSTFSTAK
jgi:hypothetical protein